MNKTNVGKSISQRILVSERYLSGEEFDLKRIADSIHVDSGRVRKALDYLMENGQICKDDKGRYYKPRSHWIHKRKLV